MGVFTPVVKSLYSRFRVAPGDEPTTKVERTYNEPTVEPKKTICPLPPHLKLSSISLFLQNYVFLV